MLDADYIQYLKEPEVIAPDAIKFTEDFYWEFSNFYTLKHPIASAGIFYPTVEHLYQAMKTMDLEIRAKIAAAKTPREAKKMGRKLSLREDWEQVKYEVMFSAVRAKFHSDNELGGLLLSTHDKQIIEWTWWGDEVWGMNSKTEKGNNALGKILRSIR